MEAMNKHRICVAVVLAIFVICLPDTVGSQEHKKGRVQITVTGGASSAPIKGADVVLRSADGDFQETDQTNSHGVSVLTNVPQGTLLITIVAPGWKTSGSQHVLNSDRLSITINMVSDRPPPTPTPSSSPSPTAYR
jgi:hypothetical protein